MAPRCGDCAVVPTPGALHAAASDELQVLMVAHEHELTAMFARVTEEALELSRQLAGAIAEGAHRLPYAAPGECAHDFVETCVVFPTQRPAPEVVAEPRDDDANLTESHSQASTVENNDPTGGFPKLRLSTRSMMMDSYISVAPDRPFLHRLVRSFYFESAMSCCILANCITVGIWAHQVATNQFSATIMQAQEMAEHCFVAVFLLELMLKLKALGFRAYRPLDPQTRGSFFDAMLVITTGLLFTWILPLLGWLAGFDTSGGPFKTLSVLRTIRLARLVRVFTGSPLFREAWMLIRGLSDSSRTLFWTIVVIFLVTYVFAIVGVSTLVPELMAERMRRTDPADLAKIDELLYLFSGMDKLMATLVQVLTGDSFHAFVRESWHFVWWSWIYFYSYISIAVMVLMNLVTAVIVENAMETSKADHELVANDKDARRRRDIEKLRRLFATMDTDGGGTLCWNEFESSFKDSELARYWTALDFQHDECRELFTLLDDGDGEITTGEFLEALSRMSGAATSKDVFKLQKSVDKLHSSIDGLGRRHRKDKKLSARQRVP